MLNINGRYSVDLHFVIRNYECDKMNLRHLCSLNYLKPEYETFKVEKKLIEERNGKNRQNSEEKNTKTGWEKDLMTRWGRTEKNRAQDVLADACDTILPAENKKMCEWECKNVSKREIWQQIPTSDLFPMRLSALHTQMMYYCPQFVLLCLLLKSNLQSSFQRNIKPQVWPEITFKH